MGLPFPFVGRSRERAELLEHVRSAVDGRGRLVLLGGEAGAGKSALVQVSASAAVAEQCQVALGYCRGPGETPPFGPWLEVTARLAAAQGWETADLAPPFGTAPGVWNAYERAASLCHWLGRSGRPLFIVIEDLQWADADTLELSRHLAVPLASLPVLVVATYRTDELSRRHPLWRLIPELQRAGAVRMWLDRLTRDDVEEWMANALPTALATPEAADSMYARTAGLPLFVRELLEEAVRARKVPTAEDPLPQTLQQALDSKLARLSPEVQAVLEAAAVIGERFYYDILARVAGVDEEDLARAIQAATDWHVIAPLDADASRFAFTHALLREALLSRLVGVHRRRWHLRVADALAAEPYVDADVMAFHLTRAGDPRAAEYLLSAADFALRLGELARARERLERALSLLPASHPRHPEALLKLGRCLGWSENERAGALWQQAQAIAQHTGDLPVAVWARHFLLDLRMGRNDPRWRQEAPEVIAAQSELLQDARYQQLEADLFGQTSGYPRAGALWVQGLATGGSVDEAWTHLRKLLGQALPGADHEVHAAAMELLLLGGRLGEAAALAGQAADTALGLRNYRSGALLRSIQLRLLLIGTADRPDELDAVARALEEAEELAWQRSGCACLPRGFSLTGVYHYFRGDWRAFLRHVVEACRTGAGVFEASLRYHAGWVLLAAGDLPGARSFVETLPPRRPEEGVPFNSLLMVLPHCLRARVCLTVLDDPAQALAWLEAAERWPGLTSAPFFRAHVRLAWARYHRHTGNLEAAWHAAVHALMDARAVASSATSIEAHRLLGELAAARGDGSEAAAKHFQAALDVAERCRFPFEVALTRLVRGRALPDAPGALADLRASRDYFAEVGAEPTLAMAQAALDAAERRAAATGAAGVGGTGEGLPLPDRLTAREAEVAALVALGLTDQEIAARLFISRKTVDRHLRNIFHKTCVSNRAALAAYATRHGLAG